MNLKSKAAHNGKSQTLRSVEVELRGKTKRRERLVTLPLVRSKQPGIVALDNAKIFEIIPFP
jgi:hypothetical protein